MFIKHKSSPGALLERSLPRASLGQTLLRGDSELPAEHLVSGRTIQAAILLKQDEDQQFEVGLGEAFPASGQEVLNQTRTKGGRIVEIHGRTVQGLKVSGTILHGLTKGAMSAIVSVR